MEVLQQVPAVQGRRAGAGGRGGLGEASLEQVDIDLDGFEIEDDGVAINQEHRFAGVGQHLAERRERLSEALAGLGLRSVAPQKGCEPLPIRCPVRREREVREQRHGFLRGIKGVSGGDTPSTSPRSLRCSCPMVRPPPGSAIRDCLLPAVAQASWYPRALRALSGPGPFEQRSWFR